MPVDRAVGAPTAEIRPPRVEPSRAQVMLAAGALLLLWVVLFGGWTFDDSYIAYRFADHLAAGSGLTWNPGEDPVEGFTSFLWVAIAAGLRWLAGVPPHLAMPWVGGLSWILMAGLVAPAALRAAGADPRATLLGAAVVLLNPYLGLHALHGLETALHGLAFGAIAAVTPDAVRGRRLPLLAGLALAALMVRPDALAYVLPLWVVLVALAFARGRGGFVLGWALGGFLVPAAVYVGLRWAYFGWPLPNTVYVKAAGGLAGPLYVIRWLGMTSPLWSLISSEVPIKSRRPSAPWSNSRLCSSISPRITVSIPLWRAWMTCSTRGRHFSTNWALARASSAASDFHASPFAETAAPRGGSSGAGAPRSSSACSSHDRCVCSRLMMY